MLNHQLMTDTLYAKNMEALKKQHNKVTLIPKDVHNWSFRFYIN